MQGQGHDGVPLVGQGCQLSRQPFGEERCQPQLALIFEGLDQPVHGMLVTPWGPGAVEVGRLLLAVATGQAAGAGFGAAGTGIGAEQRQVVTAGGTQHAFLTAVVAQQATGRKH